MTTSIKAREFASGPGFGRQPGGKPVELTEHQELALLARILHRIGYRDGLAGHLTYQVADGTLLATPHLIGWDELTASDICRMTADGEQIQGDWVIPPALQLHVALHQARSDIRVAVHNHPRWSTVWANTRTVPRAYDQTSASIDDEIVLVPYGGAVMEELVARAAATQLGDATMALLENHGVLIVGDSIAKTLWRCYVLEWRCNMAWRVETLGGGAEVPEGTSAYLGKIFDRDHQGVFPGLYEYLVRREIAFDPTVLS